MIDILIVVYLIGVGVAYTKASDTMGSGERVVHALKWPLDAIRTFQSKK